MLLIDDDADLSKLLEEYLQRRTIATIANSAKNCALHFSPFLTGFGDFDNRFQAVWSEATEENSGRFFIARATLEGVMEETYGL